MAAKRPSVAQIAARQKRLVRYQYKIGFSPKGLAEEFGVRTKDVERLLSHNQRAVRRAFNRSPNLRKLYEGIGAPTTNKVKGVGLGPLAITRAQRAVIIERYEEDRISSEQVENVYEVSRAVDSYAVIHSGEDYEAAQDWAGWARRHGVSSSMAVNRDMYDEGEIDDDLWTELIEALHEYYPKKGK